MHIKTMQKKENNTSISQKYHMPRILVGCFFIYTILSWILLFRDKRALTGISHFYPALSNFIFSSQQYLLHHGLNTIPTFIFALASVIAFYFYLKSLTVSISLKKTILYALLFQFILFLSYPILSTDIFSYIFSERVATVHHANIWHVKPDMFPSDPFSKIADWENTTNIYGGVHYVLYLLPSLIGGNNLLLLLVLFKIVPAIFTIGTGYIVYLLLKNKKSDVVSSALRIVFWNPLVLLEIFSSGHNDSVMIFFSIASYYFFKKQWWFFSGIILALAVQVKLLPIVLCFFFVAALFRKKAYINCLQFLAGFVSVNALIFSMMQISPLEFLMRVAYNGGVYWQSLPNVLRYFVSGGNIVITLCFLLWLVFFIVRQWNSQANPVYSYAVVLLVYLLFVTAAYWNWYVLWVVSLIPLIDNKKIILTSLVFSCTSLLAYPLLWLSLRFGYQSLIWPFLTYGFIFGIPILFYLFMHYHEESVGLLFKKLGLQTLFAEKAQHWV